MREAGDRPLVEVSIGYLREQRALLVLDNFEQVLGAAPFVAELLAACPRLKLLVTSRAVLRLYGERDYAVPPLALPDPATTCRPPRTWPAIAAVRLFVERAQAAQADFALTAEQRRGRRRDLPPAGRAAAGDRAGRGAGRAAPAAGDAGPAGAAPPAC